MNPKSALTQLVNQLPPVPHRYVGPTPIECRVRWSKAALVTLKPGGGRLGTHKWYGVLENDMAIDLTDEQHPMYAIMMALANGYFQPLDDE